MTWRVVGRGYWFPLAVFGLVILGATGLYDSASCPPGPSTCVPATSSLALRLAGTGLTPWHDPNGSVALYWLITLPIGFVTTVGFFHVWTRHSERRVRALPAALAGIAVLAVLVATAPGEHIGWMPKFILPGDLTIRGFIAVLIISISLLVLATSERNLSLGLFAASFVGVAFFVNLYTLSNVVGFVGTGSRPNLVFPGAVLLLGAGGLGLVELRAHRMGRRRAQEEP